MDVYTLCPDKKEPRGQRMQVWAQEMMPSASSKLKVQGEAIVCIKPQARETRLTAQRKEQCEWTRHKVSQHAGPGNSLVISFLRGTILVMIYQMGMLNSEQ